MYKLQKIHTHIHKIYHYPQQLLFTYRVTNQCLRASQPQQQPATIAVTAAARQCSVSKHRFKVIIDGDVLSVGVVHGATQCGVNAKHFRNCSIYCKNTYFASGHKLSLLPRDTCTVNNDVTPSVAIGMSKTTVKTFC